MNDSSKTHLLPYARRADFHVGRATELTGKRRFFYRCLEILPGAASWLTLIGVVLLSVYLPFIASYFVIAFALYWVLKTAFLSYHLRYNWKRLRHHMSLDWQAMIDLATLEAAKSSDTAPNTNEPVPLEAPVKYECRSWSTVDGSVFAVPTDVIFTDYATIMNMGMEFGTIYEESAVDTTTQCGLCERVEGEGKAACKAQFKCE